MPTFNDGESGSSVRSKLNTIINTVEGVSGELSGRIYRTRADFVADSNRANGLANGDIVMAEGLFYEYSSGSTTISDLGGFVPAGTVQPEHFGAVGDGVTNDHTALDAFFAYIPGFKAQMGVGKTYVDSSNTVHNIAAEGTFIDLNGNGATIDTSARVSDTTGNYLTVNPSITVTSHPLNSVSADSGYVQPVGDTSAQTYTTTLTRSSGTFSGLSEGQRAILRSNDTFPAAADGSSDTLEYVGQWVTLRDVTSTTVGVIERIKNAYTTSPVLDTFNATTYVDIRNLRMIGTPRPTTDDDGQRGIEIFYAEKVSVTNVHMERFDKYGISTDSCADVNIERNYLFTDQKAAANTSTAYGVAIHDVTENANISDNTFSGYRHAVDLTRRGGGITRNVNIARNTIQGTWLAAISMHGNHEQLIVQDNNILKCGDGINIRTPNTIVRGNYIQGCRVGINFTDTMFKTSIVDNHIEDVSVGIMFNDTALVTNPQDFIGEVYIAGNRIKACAAQAIRLTPAAGVGSTTTQLGSLLIADNLCEDATSYAVWIDGKWDNPVVDGLQAINCSSGLPVVYYEDATLGGAIRNVTYSTGNAPSAASTIEISSNTGGVLTPATFKNLNIRPFNTNDAMSIVGTDSDVNLIMADDAGSGVLKMDGGDFSFLTGGAGGSETASGATEDFYFAAGGVFKVGSGTGGAGTDTNMVTTGAASAWLNLKGGSGNAKVTIGNDDMHIAAGSTGAITFRSGAGSTDLGTEVARVTSSGLSVTGTLDLIGGTSIDDASYDRHHILRDVALWSTNSSNVTGALAVQIGVSGQNTFYTATLTIIRNYSRPVDVMIHGYFTSTGSWSNYSCKTTDRTVVDTVRFARDASGNPCVILSNNATPTSSTWSTYAKVRIKEVTLGWTGANASANQDPANYVTTLTTDISGYTVVATDQCQIGPTNVSPATNSIAFYDDSGSQAVYFQGSTGRLGVGITSPSYQLDVSNSLRIFGSGPQFVFKETDIGNQHRFIASSGDFYIQVMDSDLTNDGRLYLTGHNGDDAEQIEVRAGIFNVQSSSTSRLYVNASGKVGIGTTTPVFALDVNDNARVQQSLQVNNLIRQTTKTVNDLSSITAFAGDRSFVTDADSTTFGATPTGGGSNAVPVYFDGTVWRIG